MFSNLWDDGLHINDGGIRKFSGNISSFVKYCYGCHSSDNENLKCIPEQPRRRNGLKTAFLNIE